MVLEVKQAFNIYLVLTVCDNSLMTYLENLDFKLWNFFKWALYVTKRPNFLLLKVEIHVKDKNYAP
jgi:hypothetical protein